MLSSTPILGTLKPETALKHVINTFRLIVRTCWSNQCQGDWHTFCAPFIPMLPLMTVGFIEL